MSKASQVNPIGRNQFPFRNESSRLRSHRDKDVTMRAWQMADTDSGNIRRMAQAIELLQRQLDRLRRRAGGESAPSESRDWFMGDYDDEVQYYTQQVVRLSGVGMFVAIDDPPVGTSPDTGAPYWFFWFNPAPGVWGF